MEKSVFNNGFLEFLETEEEHTINNQKKIIKRKMVRRPPGVRALILNKNDNQKILLSKEFRYELDKWDYRLPGGKVFDTDKLLLHLLQQGQNLFFAAHGRLLSTPKTLPPPPYPTHGWGFCSDHTSAAYAPGWWTAASK